METDSSNSSVITRTHTLLGSGLVLLLSAAVGAAGHWQWSARALREEGIDPAVRLKALPTAFKALAISTGVCVSVAGVVSLGWQAFGGTIKEATKISSVRGAFAAMGIHRDLVKNELRQKKGTDGDGNSNGNSEKKRG